MADPLNTIIDRIPVPGGAQAFDYFNNTLYCTGQTLRRINLATKQITQVGPPATASFGIVALDLHQPFPVPPDVIGSGEPDGRVFVTTVSDDFEDDSGMVHFDDFEAAELTPPLLDQFRQFKLSPQAASNYRPEVFAMVVSSDARFLYYFDVKTLQLGVVDLEAGPRTLGAYQLDSWSITMVISPDNRFIYVAHPFANTISVVDTTAWPSAVRTVPVVNGPFGLDISADGKRLFIAQTGDSGTGDPSDQHTGTLTVLDTTTMQGQQLFTGNRSVDVAVNAAGTRAYVSNNDTHGTVSVVDVSGPLQVIDTITGLTDPGFLRLDADGSRLYVMDWASTPAIAVAAV